MTCPQRNYACTHTPLISNRRCARVESLFNILRASQLSVPRVGMPHVRIVWLAIKCFLAWEGGKQNFLRLQKLCILKHACPKRRMDARGKGERVTHECVCLRNDLCPTHPFQRVRRWMPHRSRQTQHGSDHKKQGDTHVQSPPSRTDCSQAIPKRQVSGHPCHPPAFPIHYYCDAQTLLVFLECDLSRRNSTTTQTAVLATYSGARKLHIGVVLLSL